MGAFFAYVGYYKKMNKQIATGMLVLGALALAYHAHLLYLQSRGEHFKGKRGPKGCLCEDPACDCE